MREMNARKYEDISLPYRAHEKQQLWAPFLLVSCLCTSFLFLLHLSTIPLKICRMILTFPLILV